MSRARNLILQAHLHVHSCHLRLRVICAKMGTLITFVLGFGCLTLVLQTHALPERLNIAIVLPEEAQDGPIDFGYRFGLHVLNRDKTLMPNTTLVPTTLYVKPGDTFRASKQLCGILNTGLVAILGAASEVDPSIEWKLFWTASTMDIPLFLPTASYANYHVPSLPVLDDYGDKRGGAGSSDPGFSVRIAPSIALWHEAIRDVVTYLRWSRAAIIYEDEKGLMKMQALLKEPAPIQNVIIRRVTKSTFRAVLEEVQNREIREVLIDCRTENLPELLRAIVQLQMTDYKYHYFFMNLDLSTADLTGYSRSNVNLTAFQIVNHESKYLKEKLKELRTYGDGDLMKLSGNFTWEKETPNLITETGLAFDSVMALGYALSMLDASHTIKPSNLTCDSSPWPDGLSLLNYITSVEFKGLTGPVAFKETERSSVRMEIIRLGPRGIKKVGMWTPERKLNITSPRAFWDTITTNVTLVVTTVPEPPYVQLRTEQNLTGNARFQGFSIDLLKSIAHRVGFKYVLEVVPDGKYGAYDHENGEWNGVVRQLIDKKADLAIGSMTINYARESVIDFTKPFMNLGISILFKVPSRPPARLFSFLNPLAVEIWVSVVVSYILVSLTMFVVARFSPHEWSSTTATILYSPGTAVGVIRNQFSLANAFWYPIGTLMQQGSDLNPKTTSTRLIGGIWWFFSLVIVSSYTANLAAFLTVERMSTPIESAEDLAEQSEITYGTLDAGSTMTFFRDSKIETFQKMWRFMESRKPSVFVSSYEAGIKRVLEGNYAFLMESTMLDYVVQQNCNLTQIGGLLDSKGYGIATPIGSPWRDKISLAILEMQENGQIQLYYNKWWGKAGASDMCNRDVKNKLDTKALGVDSIGGVFVVLLIGLILAIFVAIFEFCWHAKMNASTDRVSLCSEMAEEARFAFRCRGPRRRPALTRHCIRCHEGQHRHPTPTAYHDYHTYPHEHHGNGYSSANDYPQ